MGGPELRFQGRSKDVVMDALGEVVCFRRRVVANLAGFNVLLGTVLTVHLNRKIGSDSSSTLVSPIGSSLRIGSSIFSITTSSQPKNSPVDSDSIPNCLDSATT